MGVGLVVLRWIQDQHLPELDRRVLGLEDTMELLIKVLMVRGRLRDEAVT